jgi:S1-C subfamily serine protease
MTILSQFSDAFAALVAKTAERVVAIDAGGRQAASGLLWGPGLVVTADEALVDEQRFSVNLPDGRTAGATLAGRDPSTDIALLRLEAEAPGSAAFQPASDTRPGELAIAVGRSRTGVIASVGIVKEASGSWHSSMGGLIDQRITLDLDLDRCAHGGAVMTAEGELVGLAAFAPRRQALVIPAATVTRVTERLAASGTVGRGYAGLSLHPVRVGENRTGVMVMQLDETGPAARSGIRMGDVVVAWNGEPVRGVRDVLRRLGPDAVGTNVDLDLLRAGEPAKADLTIGERPTR